MTKEVALAERLFLKARKDFVKLATRTSRTLTREARRLGRDLKRANVRVAKLRADQTKRAEKLAKAAGASARRKLKTQVRKIGRGLDDAVAEAKNLRDLMRPVRDQVNSARNFMQHATGVDKLIARVEADWETAGRRARAKRAAAAATVATASTRRRRKKAGAKKKAAPSARRRKKASATVRRTRKKAATRRRARTAPSRGPASRRRAVARKGRRSKKKRTR